MWGDIWKAKAERILWYGGLTLRMFEKPTGNLLFYKLSKQMYSYKWVLLELVYIGFFFITEAKGYQKIASVRIWILLIKLLIKDVPETPPNSELLLLILLIHFFVSPCEHQAFQYHVAILKPLLFYQRTIKLFTGIYFWPYNMFYLSMCKTLYYQLLRSFVVEHCASSNFFPFKILWAILGILSFHINVKIYLSMSGKYHKIKDHFEFMY